MKNSTNILEELLARQVDWHPCKEKLVAINGKLTNKCNIVNTYQKHYVVPCFPSWLVWEKTDHRTRIHISGCQEFDWGSGCFCKVWWGNLREINGHPWSHFWHSSYNYIFFEIQCEKQLMVAANCDLLYFSIKGNLHNQELMLGGPEECPVPLKMLSHESLC